MTDFLVEGEGNVVGVEQDDDSCAKGAGEYAGEFMRAVAHWE